ncbi:MAG: hypothetical protein SFX72_18095 [Isosphaeraceae bacterium]|nr:hypothetical protein [Isosphaeraceae bacterium]
MNALVRFSTAAMALGLVLLAGSPAEAQLGIFGRKKNSEMERPREVQGPALRNATPLPGAAAKTDAPADAEVLPSGASIPEPLRPEEAGAPTMALPSGPIEPYLLTKDHGPFMVLAHTFRGPDAERYALALVLELRNEYRLPAFILRTRDIPGRSNIRNVPPTAPEAMRSPALGEPERFRTEDEAAVLVGNEKSLENSLKLLHDVQKIKPRCLDNLPNIWSFRKGKGLRNAIRTTNPFVPAEALFPKQADPLLAQMNAGPNSVYNCPGKFTLQIAEFSGRSSFDTKNDKRFQGMLSFKSSPLATAHADAEKLASNLARDKDIVAMGVRPYVYHDRFSSKVLIGSFDSATDPKAVALRKRLLEIAADLNNRKTSEVMIMPASSLTDLARLKKGDTTDTQVITTSGVR